jgi:hypothetical protein
MRNFFLSFSLSDQSLVSQSARSGQGRPFFGRRKRTLDGEDGCESVFQRGKSSPAVARLGRGKL